MVKLAGHRHVQAMRSYVRRKLALQKRQLVKEKEASRKKSLPVQKLPEYDPDDNGRFAGYEAIFRCEGDNYEALHRVLKKILRPAHYRTWAAANGDLVNGPPPCLAAKEIAERVGRHRRTIEIDLQEMRENRLLHLQPAQRDGRWVMEMHYDVLYRLAHEYLEWERSPDYIPAERQYFERIALDQNLKQQLLQFEDYRKVLVKKKPGPKSKKKSLHHEAYTCHQVHINDYQQNTRSDAPILPAASQGGMSRSVNLESPVPPALPQAGVSGGISIEVAAEQHVSQEFVSSGDYQEVPAMQYTYENEISSDEYTEDGAYIYRAVLPPMMQEMHVNKRGTGSIFLLKSQRVPHFNDLRGTLSFLGTVIPQLFSDLLIRKRKEYFITMAEFGPEIARLFDPDVIGAAVSIGYSPWAEEEDAIFMRTLYSEPDEDEPDTEMQPEVGSTSGEQASTQTDTRDDEYTINLSYVWTPELQRYLRHGEPGAEYFVPLTNFPPEEQQAMPQDVVGLWIWKDPETWQTRLDWCFDQSMEGVDAQPAFAALEQARTRFQQPRHFNEPSADEEIAYEMESQETSQINDGEQMCVPINTLFEAQSQERAFNTDTDQASDVARPADEPVMQEVPRERDIEKLCTVTPPVDTTDVQELLRDKWVKAQSQPVHPTSKLERQKVYQGLSMNKAGNRTHSTCTSTAGGPSYNKDSDDRQYPGSAFEDEVQEVVHGGSPGADYLAILPLLQKFMQEKILGGDPEMRYFMTYEKLASPGVEKAFPPGTDGIWIWKQDVGRVIHIKPTCVALDPALKNRSISGLSIAVGRLSDDDGQFYSDGGKPHVERAIGTSVSSPGRQNKSYDSRSRAEPGSAFSGAGSGRRRTGYGGKPHAVSPRGQQAQETYQALLAQARDGKGKGLQRIF